MKFPAKIVACLLPVLLTGCFLQKKPKPADQPLAPDIAKDASSLPPPSQSPPPDLTIPTKPPVAETCLLYTSVGTQGGLPTTRSGKTGLWNRTNARRQGRQRIKRVTPMDRDRRNRRARILRLRRRRSSRISKPGNSPPLKNAWRPQTPACTPPVNGLSSPRSRQTPPRSNKL